MSEALEDLGATEFELIEAIHAGANVKDIARLEGAIWRLFDRAHALHYFMRVRNELQQKNSHLRKALRPLAEARLFAGNDYWVISAGDMERARAALKDTEE